MSGVIRYLGHAFVEFTTADDKIILFDPWTKDDGNPACPLETREIERADLVLVSHYHSDHIVIEGRAKKLVYIWIDDNELEVKDACDIWGLTVSNTDDAIKAEIGDQDIQIVCIGPAGENLSRCSCVITNRARAVGRCGLGAVLGSKNLKAVAVRGRGEIYVACPDTFMEEVERTWKKLESSRGFEMFRRWGTIGGFRDINDNLGMLAKNNFQDEYVNPEDLEKISREVYKDTYEIGRLGYTSCAFSCSHIYHIKDGPYAELTCEGFESNDIVNFGGRLGIYYAPAIIKAHCLCNEYGLDQDNAAGSIAWAFECYQRNILTEKETDGLSFEWGNHETVMELLRKIAYREGFGDILAEGSKIAAERLGRGSERFAIHIKGQDSMEPMRAAKGWALGCAVSTRGGAHTRGASLQPFKSAGMPKHVYEQTWGISEPGDIGSYENKAEIVVYYERFQAIMDSLGICILCSNWSGADLLGPDDLARLYSAATGYELTGEDLMIIGERIHNIEKAFNVLHAGFNRGDDYPPQRFMEEPVKSGPARGEILLKKDFDRMLDEYYEIHGWDKDTGWQKKDQLENWVYKR